MGSMTAKEARAILIAYETLVYAPLLAKLTELYIGRVWTREALDEVHRHIRQVVDKLEAEEPRSPETPEDAPTGLE